MNPITKKTVAELGRWVDQDGSPLTTQKEARLRDDQKQRSDGYRNLRRDEIQALERQDNQCGDWGLVMVRDGFRPELVQRCRFHGLVRLGTLSPTFLEFHDLQLAVGIYDSTIISSDIGDDVAIHHVHCLSHYLVGSEVILFNVDEMLTTNHAKFGNGIIKEGESESVRIWLEVGNENGGRKILPFDGLMPGDAYLWSRYRSDAEFRHRLAAMTENAASRTRNQFGRVGERCVIKSCRIIKDVLIGSHAYIKGANKLKNLTIKSDDKNGTQIGEGCELVNGIIEYGCRIFYGVKAVRFYVRTNVSLKYGARIINSVVGDNSTISCCEVLNSLVFPAHEQHHNNSFLCAATVHGQSNIAAGATIGSNHNSRANEGEILAGRGFWPGLCVSLKHSSRFASYCLLVKGSYPHELDVPLPFCLVSNSEKEDRLHIIPAYWFLYNMYALARNSWKYIDRDKRLYESQSFEYDHLAPDTVNEMMNGLHLLEKWAAQDAQPSALSAGTSHSEADSSDLQLPSAADGVKSTAIREAIRGHDNGTIPATIHVAPFVVEASRREVVIEKASEGYATYREMIRFYCVRTLADFMACEGISGIGRLNERLQGAVRLHWINVGGQLMPEAEVEAILADIKSQVLADWNSLHQRYRQLAGRYMYDKAAHAYATLLELERIKPEQLDSSAWCRYLELAEDTQQWIYRKTRESREKDYRNPFKRMLFADEKEMLEVMGPFESNDFIRKIEQETREFSKLAATVRA